MLYWLQLVLITHRVTAAAPLFPVSGIQLLLDLVERFTWLEIITVYAFLLILST